MMRGKNKVFIFFKFLFFISYFLFFNNLIVAQSKNKTPLKPGDNYKLNWLLAAGNINVCLPDYVKFIQLQLQGLQGESDLLSKDEFHFLHFGLYKFSVGWFASVDDNGHKFSYNIGNPGTFLSKVFIYPFNNKAIILLSNAQSDEVDAGMELIMTDLKRDYFH